jgi:hypothetical protein
MKIAANSATVPITLSRMMHKTASQREKIWHYTRAVR